MSRALVRWVAVSVVVLLVVGGTLDVTAATDQAGGDSESDIDPERVDMRIQLHPNATATWTIEYAYRLDSDNRSAAFDDLQADIRANRSRYRSSFRSTIGSSVARARNDTGREMAMQDVSVRAHRQQIGRETGLVTYRFRWTNFSRVSGSRLVAGGAIDGFIADEKTRLEISWPAEYELVSVHPTPPDERTETAVVWDGYTNFAPGQPRLTVDEESNATATQRDDDTPGTATRDGTIQASATPAGAVDPPGGTVLATLLATVVVLVGTLGWAHRHTGDEEPSRPGGGPGSRQQDEDVPMDLMSNEERVLYTLRERGGRMKQTVLREELDWPAPKTSKVLGDLKDDDAVDVFRLGRENVVTLPDTGLMEDSDE